MGGDMPKRGAELALLGLPSRINAKTKRARLNVDENRSVDQETVSAEQLRKTVGTFPSGVTVVTARNSSGEDIGMAVSSFASLSMDPPMILVSVANTASAMPHLGVGTELGISVLAEGQGWVARQFSRKGIDRFEGVDTWRGTDEVVLIDDAAAWFTGKISAALPGGDHTIFTVLVDDCGTTDDARPLLYKRGQTFDRVEYQI